MLRYVLVLVVLAIAAPAAAAPLVPTEVEGALDAPFAFLDASILRSDDTAFAEPRSEPTPSGSPSASPRREPAPLAPVESVIPLIDFPPVDLAPVEALVAASVDALDLASHDEARAAEEAASDAPLTRIYVGHDAAVPAAAVTPGLALAAVAAVTAAAPMATSGFAWERLRRLALAAALYTRIAKERLLDHAGRERLLQVIRERPGAPVMELAALAGIARNTTVYHLHRLEREGLVSSTKNGRMRLYFAPGARDQRERAPAIMILRNPVTQRFAAEVGASPGLDQRALCARLGLAPSLAHWHAARLVEAGVVTRERDGRNVRYYPVQ